MKQIYLFTFICICCIVSISKITHSQTITTHSSPNNQLAVMGTSMLYPAEKPKISVQRGFYKKPFDVVVSTGVDGMMIYYTLDGSDPATSKYAMKTTSPARIHIDPQNLLGRGKTPGVVLRARAKSDNYEFSPIATCTYLFIDRMDLQTSAPGHDWPYYSETGQTIDLGMDSRILTDSIYSKQMNAALLEIPTVSICTDNANLFAADSGIYVNAFGRGLDWERPVSVELINPDGSDGFQLDAGLRIRGGWSRNPFFRKHAFRLFFRNEYGEAKLNFPMFGDEGVQSFDKLDLRCAQNYSWSKGGSESPYFTFTRDVFSRDVQGKMDCEYTRSRYYHLYINGLYWGLYQTQERSEASFAADYMGGIPEDYDVVKRAGEGNSIEATDGNLDAWREVWDMCVKGFASNTDYFKLQGLNENGVRDPNLKVLVDIDNLIDYMNIIFYTGNFDAPVSSFMNNKGSNNFYAVYNRNSDRGFTFFAHDNEHTLLVNKVPGNPNIGLNENRVNIGSISGGYKMEVAAFEQFHPQWLHFKLSQNAEYRQRFSDRSYKMYYNNGVLTPERTAELFKKRSLEIDTAVIAESARWGDVDYGILRTKVDWSRAVDETMTGFFPFRTDIVISQLKAEGLLSNVDAPVFNIKENEVADENLTLLPGEVLEITNPNETGNISYTIDGSDPRLINGIVSPTAANGGTTTSISVMQTCIIKARIYNNGIWSPLHTINLSVDPRKSGLQVTEINYNPLGAGGVSGSEYEFIELKNIGITPVNLTAAKFTNGIQFSFNEETYLEPGKFIVLSSNSIAFNQRYGFLPFGEYEGQLDNKGERITMVNAVGDTVIDVNYKDSDPWPTAADGIGFSLVPSASQIGADWNNGANWRSSSAIYGSPNADDHSIEIPKILINEILTNTDAPQTDAIELYNPNTIDVQLGGWYLSDKRSTPKKWKIPAETVIPANGYLVFQEGHYENDTIKYNDQEFGSSFSLSSLGENIYLFSGSSTGELTGYETGYNFDAVEAGVSFGRYVGSNGKEHFVAQKSTSLNAENGLPRVGPVIINQIMYNPSVDQFEYLELVNSSGEKVDLFDEVNHTPWKVSGIDFEFPDDVSIEPGQSVYLVEQSVSPDDFKALYDLDASTQVFNYNGRLKNEGEEIELLKSFESYFENGTLKIPYIRIDKVNYNDNSQWPDADGNSNALQRVDAMAFGNDPASWKASSPAMRIKNNSLPDGIEGVPYTKELTVVGGKAPFTWSTSGDGLPEGLSMNPVSGLIDGTPAVSGLYNVKIRLQDSGTEMKEVEFSLNIQPNTLPEAINDTIGVGKNHFYNIPVIANDIDHDGDKSSWEIEVTSEPTKGIFIINNDRSISYKPELNYQGLDSITYRVTDLKGSSEAKVIIFVVDDSPALYTYQFVSQGNDDAEENLVTGKMNLTSTTLDMAFDATANASQIVGIRFNGLALPEGAKILNSFLIFNSARVNTATASLTIQGEASVNPVTYKSTELISSRPTTTASVNWSPEPWEKYDDGTYNRISADITPILNELIGLGWKSGNSMAFMIKGEGVRTARSYNSGQWSGPVLYVIYTDPNAVAPTPIALAKALSTVGKGVVVQLDGTESNSPDGRVLNYFWSITSRPEGSVAQLSNPHSVVPTFIADQFGTYEITLKVDNGVKESETVHLTINALNHEPLANAGSNQIQSRGSLVRLTGSGSTDEDGDLLSYEWEWLQKPENSLAELNSSTEANPKFTADQEGIYILGLKVADYYSSSTLQTVEITVIANQTPLADAGNDVEVVTGSVIALDGTKSSDPEKESLTYLWTLVSKPDGSNLTIPESSKSKPVIQPDVAGEYLIQLTVSDGANTSTVDEVKITAVDNRPPVALAGDDLTTSFHHTVTLDGSKSYDPEGQALIYQWSFITKPQNSNASIQGANTSNPSVHADKEGLYTLKLKVSDGSFTNEDQVQITADNNTGVELQKSAKNLTVYPNPFTENLVVEYSTLSNQRVEFNLYNMAGSIIKQFVFNSVGKNTQTLNLGNENLKSGIYFLMMKPENGEPQTVKVVRK
jgi:hypothetical protein